MFDMSFNPTKPKNRKNVHTNEHFYYQKGIITGNCLQNISIR